MRVKFWSLTIWAIFSFLIFPSSRVEIRFHPRSKLIDQGALLLFLDEHIVGADAGLPAIELLGCGQIGRDLLHVRAFIDDDG